MSNISDIATLIILSSLDTGMILFDMAKSFGTFLTKFTSIVAALFIICSIAIVAISRDELRETQSVLEKQEEENSDLPQIPQTK